MVVNAATGYVAQKISCNELGAVLSDTNAGFRPFYFAGGLYDTTTKLLHFGAREYNPSIGRWLSKDPIGFDGGDTNLYGYVLNDPVNLVDPEGKSPAAAWGVIGVGTGVLIYKYNTDPFFQMEVDMTCNKIKNMLNPFKPVVPPPPPRLAPPRQRDRYAKREEKYFSKFVQTQS